MRPACTLPRSSSISTTGAPLPEGGDYESENLNVYGFAGGRITRMELFEVYALDAALARFEELSSS